MSLIVFAMMFYGCQQITPIEMANLIYESGLVEYAAPEFILESSPASAPNDTYFTAQWNLNNTIYPIADINYCETINSFTLFFCDKKAVVSFVHFLQS